MTRLGLFVLCLALPLFSFNPDSGRDDQQYFRGVRALDKREFEEAIQRFSDVARQSKSRGDAALYWKAYAQNRLGRRDDALATLEELRKSFVSSRWLDDAKALEVEVRQAAGRPVSPEGENDEELKLIAINSLMSSDPERALPLLEKLVQGSHSPKLKERALFVLAQSGSARGREIVTRIAKGQSNPDVQLKAVEYLGLFGGTESRQALSEIYSASTDIPVKRAILRSFAIAKERDRLVAAAKGEKDQELRREAIRGLGIDDKATDALTSLYATEADIEVRKEVIRALSLRDNAKSLVALARKETNPELKKEIVQSLSRMKSKEGTEYLLELLNK